MWDAAFSLLLFVDGKNFGPAMRNLLRRVRRNCTDVMPAGF